MPRATLRCAGPARRTGRRDSTRRRSASHGDGGAGAPDSCRLFEGVPDLEDGHVVTPAADDLDAHREPVRREPGRHGEGGLEGDRVPIRGPHPVEVGLEGYAVDLGRPGEAGRERGHLVDRADDDVVAVVEGAHPLEDHRVVAHGLGDVLAGEGGAGLGLGHRLRLHLVAMGREERAEPEPGHPGPDGQEHLLGALEVRLGVLHDAAEVLERRPAGVDDRSNAGVEGQAARDRAPRHPEPGQVAIEWSGESGGIGRVASRIAQVVARHHAQTEGHIADRAGEDALHDVTDQRQRRRPGRDQPDGRSQRGHVVEVGRVAQRAAVVAAVRDRQHAGGEGRGGAAARATRGPGQVVGVAGGAVDRVVGVGAQTELGDVRLADRDDTRPPQALDDDGVRRWPEVPEDGRALRVGESHGRLGVLERRRQAVQRADRRRRGPGGRRRHRPGRGTPPAAAWPRWR